MEVLLYRFPMTVRYKTFNHFPAFIDRCKLRDASLHYQLAKVSPDAFPLSKEPSRYFVSEVSAFGNGSIEEWTVKCLDGG